MIPEWLRPKYENRHCRVLDIKEQIFALKEAFYPAYTEVERDMECIEKLNQAIYNLEWIDNYLLGKR